MMPAIPQTAVGLKSGAVSVVFHVPYEYREKAFKTHDWQGKSVRLEIYLED